RGRAEAADDCTTYGSSGYRSGSCGQCSDRSALSGLLDDDARAIEEVCCARYLALAVRLDERFAYQRGDCECSSAATQDPAQWTSYGRTGGHASDSTHGHLGDVGDRAADPLYRLLVPLGMRLIEYDVGKPAAR